jgi:hypothetical protein
MERRQDGWCFDPDANRSPSNTNPRHRSFEPSFTVHLLQCSVFIGSKSRLAGSVMRVSCNNEPTYSAYEYGLLVFRIEIVYHPLSLIINGTLVKCEVTGCSERTNCILYYRCVSGVRTYSMAVKCGTCLTSGVTRNACDTPCQIYDSSMENKSTMF